MERVLEPEVMDTVEEADAYEAMDHSAPNAAFLGRLEELGASGRMLDIGTGPGHLPVLVCEANLSAEVVGIDLAKKMLVHAEKHQQTSSACARIQLLVMDAKDLEFDDDSFDVVFSNTILHHIPDPLPFLRESFRVLKPDGVLLIRDLFRPPSPAAVAQLVSLHAESESEYAKELFRASLCAAFTPQELKGLAVEVGMANAEVVIDTDRHMSLQIPAKVY